MLEAENIDLTLNLDKSYIETIKQLPIKKSINKTILLSDVAKINLDQFQKKLYLRPNQKQINLKTVGIGIYAKTGASTVELSKEIKKE